MGNPRLSDDGGGCFWYTDGEMNEIRCRSGQAGKTMEQPTRVLIADDRPRSRSGLRAVLALRPEIEIVGEAADGQEALRLVEECRPDVVLMDARMPVMDGVEGTRLIKERWPKIRVVVLTIHASYRADALAAGADQFLIKGCPVVDLMKAILDQ
jgi:DNA-binding NarL/FixJ family response regulator